MADRSCWGDFEVQRELGRGTWGIVVLARRRQDGACYALKIVQLDKRSHKDQLAAVQECQLLASLDSTHITRYYDSFLHDGRLVIVMEWAPGGSLHAAIGRSARPLPEEGIWRVLLHITLALHHMHSRRMLHRDVKSLNVFLTGPLDSQGWHTQCKLGDVGVSKVLEEGKSHASTLIGTPFYLSPEICQEKPYDAKSDMWALGVVLYECATRRHPFDAQSQPSLILKILRGRYEPVLGLSSDLTAIINRCLSQSAARRPSAERLLSLPVVRAKAVELGIELPPGLMAAVTASPSGSFSLGERNVKGSPGSARVSIDPRAGARPERVPGRRATCPHGAPPAPAAAAPAPRRNVVGRRSTPHEGLEGRRISVNGAAMERRKPPLPAAAVPTRRQTEQPRSKLSLINSLQGAPSVQLQRMSLAPTPAALLAEASALQPLADQYVPVPAETGSPQTELSSFGSSPTTTGTIPAAVGQAGQHQISPRRQSHFSVLHHMQALSGAAHQWLAQRSDSEGRASGGACGGPFPAVSAVAAAALVECSVKSDSSLLPPRRLAEQAEAVSPPVALAAMPSEREEEEEEKQAMLRALRKRCVALLGSEELFEELHGLAQPAAEGGGGDGAAPRPTTLAALGDALFARVGYSGNAAEGLHLLMRILAME